LYETQIGQHLRLFIGGSFSIYQNSRMLTFFRGIFRGIPDCVSGLDFAYTSEHTDMMLGLCHEFFGVFCVFFIGA